MYPAEAGLMFFPYLQGVLPDLCHNQQVELLCSLREDDMPNLSLSRTVTEYDLGGEGDLFKAPEPIIEEPEYDLAAAISSLISASDGVIPDEEIGAATVIGTAQNDQPLNEIPVSDCNEDAPSKSAITGDEGAIQRCVSSGSLRTTRPCFLDFPAMDLQTVFGGMRRAYSEGDIQNLGQPLLPPRAPPFERLPTICDRVEDRRQKLSRYRRKKTRRNFGRKIEYACRKALADSQPRVRGRFAKNDESESGRPPKQ